MARKNFPLFDQPAQFTPGGMEDYVANRNQDMGYQRSQQGLLSLLGAGISGGIAPFVGDNQWLERRTKQQMEQAQSEAEFRAALLKLRQQGEESQQSKDFQNKYLQVLAGQQANPPLLANEQQVGFAPMVEGFTSTGKPRVAIDTPLDQWQRGSKLRDELIGSKEYSSWKTTNDFATSANAMYDAYKKGDIGRLTVDQTLISNLNKLNDPTSVPMISEYARTSNDMSLKNKFKGAIEKLDKGGAGLTDSDREVLIKSINVIKDSRDKSFGSTLSNYKELAKSAKLNPDSVFKGLGISPEKQKNESGFMQTKSGLKYRVE